MYHTKNTCKHILIETQETYEGINLQVHTVVGKPKF